MDAIFDFLYRMQPRELVIVLCELFFIGAFVYMVLTFLEGTRGERLFRGILFILLAGKVILNLVVERFDMARVSYLYNGFLIAILIIAVAAFQPEIRRALIRLGQARFLSSASQQLSRSVEEIINAVTDLAATKTGAIIVVERQVALGEFIETGERIDAKVTAELLKTIFYPGTPLHDMAVVIRADRIVAARVQLPLAESGSFRGGQLGSRHRAAIGISSSSDAIVIVVSEETGIISLAVDGNLVRNVSQAQLRKQLTSAVVEAPAVAARTAETDRTDIVKKPKAT